MIKPYHLLLTFVIGIILGVILYSYWPQPDTSEIEDPQIHRLQEEIAWRNFNEKKKEDTIKILKQEKIAMANYAMKQTQRADQSEAKLKEHRAQPIPATTSDTISFLIEDDTLCSEALADSKKLSAALTIEVMTDEAIIKGQGELIDSLQEDKKDLQKIDTLHQEEKKQIEKKVKKNFWKGFSWGALFLGAAELAWKIAILLL